MKAYILFQTDVHKTKSSRVCFGVFSTEEKAEARLNVLEGVIRALSILDDVIRTIRASKNKADFHISYLGG